MVISNLLPDVGNQMNIFITNFTLADRKNNYLSDGLKPTNLPDSQIAHTKGNNIFIPVDVYASSEILNGHKYTEGNKLVPIFSNDYCKTPIQNNKKIILSLILNHEIGHYYFSKIIPPEIVKEHTEKQGFCDTEREQVYIWYKKIHESFADCWTVLTNTALYKNTPIGKNNILESIIHSRDISPKESHFNLEEVHNGLRLINYNKNNILVDALDLSSSNATNKIKDKKIIAFIEENFMMLLKKNNTCEKINSVLQQTRDSLYNTQLNIVNKNR